MLSSRTETILKSIVEEYITRATPVPSQSLVNDYPLGVSPATIRNEMAHLEQEGYITRPYPSAGSIPSDRGYRFYVESLAEIKLPLAEQRLISHLLHQVERELVESLHLAATVVAQMAQNMALVTMPKPANCRFKHLELVAVQESLVLLVLVLHGAKVRQKLITFDQPIPQPRLTIIASKLNANYSGLTSARILAKGKELPPAEQQITDCLVEMLKAEDEQEYEEPFFHGLHFMLNQPEFARAKRMLDLMELVEQRKLLETILPRRRQNRGVQVIIGKENKAEVIQECSVIIGRYGLPEEATGTMAVIGPTRMPYARVISTIGYLSSLLNELVAKLYKRETHQGNVI